MTDESRKATDIVLSLEEKINTLTKIVGVYDMNIKIILDRVNKIYSYIEMLQREMAADQNAGPVQNIQSDKDIVEADSEHALTVSDKPMNHRRTPRSEMYTSEVLPATPIQAPPTQVVSSDNNKKVPVIQRVTWVAADSTTKDLYMAEVSILNENKELVSKVKTNAAGKWQAYLKPGSYTINIVKTDTATKRKIEALQDIQVNDSNTTLTLPTVVIKK